MKNIVEALGETVAEIIGAGAVIAGIFGALALFRSFGDTFISYFI